MKFDHEALREAAAAADNAMAEDVVIDPATGFAVMTGKQERWLRMVEGLGLVERVWKTEPSGRKTFTLRLTDKALAALRAHGNA
jgi:hypothetical protein